MAYDIYGNNLRKGYCEVHPYVYEEYPCYICLQESARIAREKADERMRDQQEMFKDQNSTKLYTKEQVEEISTAWARYCRDTDFLEALLFQEWFEKNIK